MKSWKRKLSSIFNIKPRTGRVFGAKKNQDVIKPVVADQLKDLTKQEAELEGKLEKSFDVAEIRRLGQAEQNKALEIKMFLIQKSTNTTLPQFIKLHNKLRMRYKWYYKWHLMPIANKLHWGVLGTTTTVLVSLIIFSALTLGPKILLASQEPKLVVTETNPVKTPCKFFFKSDSDKCDQLWQKISDDEKGLRIRTKSGTAAGFQDILILGNDMSLFDGEKLVATAKIQPQEQVDGKWQDIGEVRSTKDEATPAPSETATPEAMINSVIERAHAADVTPAQAGVQSSESITKGDKQDLKVESKATLDNEKDLSTTLEVKTTGQKQTFSLPANPNGNPQRIVLNVDLKDYDIKSDSSQAQNDPGSHPEQSEGSRTYNQVILDTSDYKGQAKIEEKASTDEVNIIFNEAGSTGAIEIDPILTVTQPADQISVADGTRTWLFDDSAVGAPKYFYHTSIGSGATNIASNNTGRPYIGPGFLIVPALSSVTQTLVENTPTRVKIRAQGAYVNSPTAIDNYYTIYPDGKAFLTYNETVAGAPYALIVQYMPGATAPQVQNVDSANLSYVASDTSNNTYPGMAVVPYTTSEFGGTGSWTTLNQQATNFTEAYKSVAAGTYTGNMVIDFSNYRATTTTRDNLRDDYRTPATLANFDKGTVGAPAYSQGEGTYNIAADASGDAKFDFQYTAKTRYKPAFKIASATRNEDNYQVKVGGVLKTKGVDYNLSKIDATTVIMQWLSDVSSDLVNLEISGETGVTGAQIAVGSYTGDGGHQSIATVGFQPDLVIVKSQTTAQYAVFKTSDMAGDTTLELANAAGTFVDGIESLDALGFSIGTDARVNTNAVIYHWQAFKDNGSADFTTGTYAGNGTDNRNVVTGLSFSPALVLVKQDGANYAWAKPSSLADDASYNFYGGPPTANRIQALNSDGFQVGTNASVNANGSNYYWFAFAEVAGWMDVGTYVGNSVDSRSITGVGFQPNLVLVLSDVGATYGPVYRPSTLAGDNTLLTWNYGASANYIQAIESDGFQVGSGGQANQSGFIYNYIAFKSGTVAFAGNKIWDGGGANDNWSTAANWSGDVAPVASDSVQFGATSTDNCIIDTAQNAASITIGTGYTGTITANAALTVTGDFSLEQGTYNANGQALNIGGSFSRVGGTFTHGNNTTTFTSTSTGKTILSGGQSFYNLTFNGAGGGWTLQDNITATNLTITAGNVIDNAKQVLVNGDISIGGTLTSTGSWIQGASGSLSNPSSANKIRNLTIAGAGVATTLTNHVYVGSVSSITNIGLTIGSGTLNGANKDIVFYNYSASNTLTVNNPTMGSALNAFYYYNYAYANQTISALTLPNGFATSVHLKSSVATASFIAGGNLNFGNNNLYIYDVTGGGGATPATSYVDMATYNLTATGNVYLGTSAVNGYLKLGSGMHSIAGDLTYSGAGTANKLDLGTSNLSVGGNINLTNITVTNGTGAQLTTMTGAGKTLTSAGQTIHNFAYNSAGTLTIADTYRSDGDFTITAGTVSPGNQTMNVGGNWTSTEVGGTFTPGTSTVVFTGTSKTLAVPTSSYSTGVFHNLTFNGSTTLTTTTWLVGMSQATSTILIGNNATLTINSGVTAQVYPPAQTLTINNGATLGGSGVFAYYDGATTDCTGLITNSGTISIAQFNFYFGGGHTFIIPALTFGGNLKIAQANAFSNIVQLGAGTLTVGGNLWVKNSAGQTTTLDNTLNNTPISIGGSFDFGTNAVYTKGSETITFTATVDNKTITSGSQLLPALSFNGTSPATWQLQDNLTSASLAITGTGTLIDNAKTVTVNGNIAVANTAGLLTSTGSWIQGASGNLSNPNGTGNAFRNLTIAGSGVITTLTGNVYVGQYNSSTNIGLTIGSGTLYGANKNLFFYNDSTTNTLTISNPTMGSALSEFFYYSYANQTISALTLPNGFGVSFVLYMYGGNITAGGNLNFGNINVYIGSAQSGSTPPTTYIDMTTYSLATTGKVYIGRVSSNGYLKLGSGAHSVSGDLTYNGTGTADKLDLGTSNLSVGGNINLTNIAVTNGGGAQKVTMADTVGGKTITSAGALFNDLEFNGVNGGWTLQDDLTVGGNLTIANGQFSTGARTVNLAGNWLHTGGTFTAGTSTVNLNGTDQAVSGTNSFFNFNKSVAADRTLTFESDLVQTVSGLLTLKSTDPTKLLALRSSASPTQWQINPTGARDIDYIDLMDSKNNAAIITVAHAKDSGNNTNWYLTDNYIISTHADQVCGIGWTETVQAKDFLANNSTSDSATQITLTASTGTTKYYTNATYLVETTTYFLTSGVRAVYVKDMCPNNETITLTSTDAYAKAATSGNIALGNDPPTAAITSPANNQAVGAGTVQIAGTAADTKGGIVAKVEVQIDADAWAEATGTTDWSYNYAVSTSATHTVKARATDSLGLLGPETAAITFTVDTETPSVVITKPVLGEWITSATYDITGTSADLGTSSIANIQISLDGGTWHDASGTTTWTYAWTVVDGDHTFMARATDGVGNVSQSYTLPIKADTTAPSKPSNIQAFNVSNLSSAKQLVFLSWKASTDAGSGLKEYQIFKNGVTLSGSEGSNTDSSASPQNDKTYYIDEGVGTYTVKAIDNAGNISTSDEAKVEANTAEKPSIKDTKATPSKVVSKDSKTTAIIQWQTNTPTTSLTQYGLGGAKANQSKPDGRFNMGHTVVITDLKPQTTYHYAVSGSDVFANKVSSQDLTFTTAQAPTKEDALDVIIKTLQKSFEWFKKVMATPVLDKLGLIKSPEQASPSLVAYDVSSKDGIAQIFVTVTAKNSIERGTDGKTFSAIAGSDLGYYLDTDVKTGTTYYYRAKGVEGMVSVSPGGESKTPPIISDAKATELSVSEDAAEAMIQWQTDKLSDSKVSIGTPSTTLGAGKTYADPGYGQSHTLVLSDLQPGQVLKYKVSSVTEDKLNATSPEHTLTTSTIPPKEGIFQMIFDALRKAFDGLGNWLKA